MDEIKRALRDIAFATNGGLCPDIEEAAEDTAAAAFGKLNTMAVVQELARIRSKGADDATLQYMLATLLFDMYRKLEYVHQAVRDFMPDPEPTAGDGSVLAARIIVHNQILDDAEATGSSDPWRARAEHSHAMAHVMVDESEKSGYSRRLRGSAEVAVLDLPVLKEQERLKIHDHLPHPHTP